MQWKDILDIAPCFVLNMDKCKNRWTLAKSRILEAGFNTITRVSAFDATNCDLPHLWNKIGCTKLRDKDEFIENKGKQAVALGHYNIWKHIVDNDLPVAVIFEDDVMFHKEWDWLAQEMWDGTPKDFDLIFMGSSFDVGTIAPIIKAPVFCMHAYVITKQGAQKCLDVCLKDPEGTWTIDWMLRTRMLHAETCPFKWYVWNGLGWHDPKAFTSKMWQHNIKNKGFVFQDWTLGSDIDAVLDIRQHT